MMPYDKNPEQHPKGVKAWSLRLSGSCEVSNPGGGAVHSPRRAGGARADGPTDDGRGTRRGPSRSRVRENEITEVGQAGQDEAEAAAGSVAVTVTPSELRLARVIGQVRTRLRSKPCGTFPWIGV